MEHTTETEPFSCLLETPIHSGLDVNDLEPSVECEVNSMFHPRETEKIAGNVSTKLTSSDGDGPTLCQVKTNITEIESDGPGVSKKLTVHTYTVIQEKFDELHSCFIKSEDITSASLTNTDSSRETGNQENYHENSFAHNDIIKEEETRRADGVLMTDVAPSVTGHLFECELCGKCFSVMSKLKKHRLLHSGENKRTRSSTSKRKVSVNQASEGISGEDQQTFLPGGAICREDGVLQSIKSEVVSSSSHVANYAESEKIQELTETRGSVADETALTESVSDGELAGLAVPTVKSEDSLENLSTGPYRNIKITKRKRRITDKSLSSQTETHAQEEPFFRCDKCGKGFPQEKALKKHVWVHNRGKPCKCEHCGKCFTYASDLVRHMRAHTGEKPFKCDYCEKSFGIKSHLVTHLKTHLENTESTNKGRNRKCEICGKCYTQNSHLKLHMQLHTGEKPCSCTVCGKGFTKRNHLERHMKIHTKEILFNCFLCGKGFSRKDHLKSHMQRHVELSCRHCNETFDRKGQLTKHMKTCNKKS